MTKRPSFAQVTALTRRSMMTDPALEVAEPAAAASLAVEAAAAAEPPATPQPEAVEQAPRASSPTRTRQGVRGDQEDRRPVRRGKRALTFWVNPEPHKQFKMLCVREDRPGQDFLEEALDDLFAKYGMHRIAKQR
jgi:hypothetical protein